MKDTALSVGRRVSKKWIEEILSLVHEGMEYIRLAAEQWVKIEEAAKEQKIDLLRYIRDNFPGTPQSVFLTLSRIGNGKVTPKVALMDQHNHGVRALVEMPIEIQQRCEEAPVEVLIIRGDGKKDKRLIRVDRLTQAEARQVFDRQSLEIRNLEEQAAYLERIATPANARRALAKASPGGGWKIVGDNVVVTSSDGPISVPIKKILLEWKTK